MAADANIFQQYLKPVRSVADYSNDMDKQEQNALTLVASRMKGQQDQQSMADDQSARAAYQQSEGDPAKYRNALVRAGNYKAVQAIDAASLASEKTRADTSLANAHAGKFGADTNAASYELSMKKHDQAVKDIAGFQTPQQAIDSLTERMKSGDIDPAKGQAMMQSIPQDPAQFAAWQLGMLRNIMSAKDQVALQVPDANNVNTNQTSASNNAATNATSRSNNAATVGASLSNAAATREVAGATRYAANAQRDQATEMKLADDYRAQSKEFGAATSAHKQLNATLGSATSSPAATLAAATKFMKILDPGSVVRESELGMALQASGVLDRAANYVNVLQRGKVLTPTQAADFKDISQKMYGAAQQVQQTIDADYKGKAKAYGLRPEMVTQDLGQNAQVDMASAIAEEIARRAKAKK